MENSSNRLAQLVGEKQAELMRQDSRLSARDAFLKATDLVLKKEPTLLSAYRAEAQRA